MSFHLSDFAYFVNTFIRYRSKQRTSELSVIVTKMVWFYSRKEIFFAENLNKFHKCLLKAYTLYFLNSIQVSIYVVL